jgi:hypothetical protein
MKRLDEIRVRAKNLNFLPELGSARNNTSRGTEEGTDGEVKRRNLEPM